MDKKKTLSAFLRILVSLIKVRIAFAFTCTEQRSQAEILRYFNNLIRIRANEFLQAHGQKHPQKERKIAFYSNQLPRLVKKYQLKMQTKARLFVEEQGRKGRELHSHKFVKMQICLSVTGLPDTFSLCRPR